MAHTKIKDNPVLKKLLKDLIRWFSLLTLVIVASNQAGTSLYEPERVVPGLNPNGDLLSELDYTNQFLKKDEVLWRRNTDTREDQWNALESDALWLTEYPRESLFFNFGMGFFYLLESPCEYVTYHYFKTRCNDLAQRWKTTSFYGFNDLNNGLRIIFCNDVGIANNKPYGVGLINMHALIKWFDGQYPLNDENLEKISQWQINRDPDSKTYRIPPAPQLVNLSMGNRISRLDIEGNENQGDKADHSCGGKAVQNLFKESRLITIVAHENNRAAINTMVLNCPYNIGVAGYDMYATKGDTYTGHAPIAKSHDLRIFMGKLGESLSSELRTVSVPYGRVMHNYPKRNGREYYTALNPFSWEPDYVGGNSLSTPLVTGVVAEMMLLWPKASIAEFNQQKIYDLLNYGSWRRAYPVNAEDKPVGPRVGGVPIINIPCAMASVLVANLQARGQTNASMGTIYSELGPEKHVQYL